MCKGVITIIKIYVRKIRAGQMELSEVPLRWHDAVEAALNENE